MVMPGCRQNLLSYALPLLVALSTTAGAQPRRVAPRYSNRYALVLEDAPVLDRFPGRAAANSLAAQSYRLQVEARQRSMRSELESRGIPVSGAVSTSSNALFVTATPERAAELRALPGVAGVVRMRMLHDKLNRAT